MDIFDSFSKMSNLVSGQLHQDIDINKVMSEELGGVVDFGLWLETVDIQKKFNNLVAPGWKESPEKYDFWMAILDETVEVLGSKHWKWWKKDKEVGEIDWNNVQVEIIDLFHFILSVAIQHDSQNILFSQIVNLEMNKETQVIRPDDFFSTFWDEFMLAVQNRMLPLAAIRIVEYWYKAGGDAHQLFMEYRIKAALNNIRQEFGYGVNYQKMWLDTETGQKVEDNVIAKKLAAGVELNTETIKNIEDKLRKYYLLNVAV
jgi:hypothetical protein